MANSGGSSVVIELHDGDSTSPVVDPRPPGRGRGWVPVVLLWAIVAVGVLAVVRPGGGDPEPDDVVTPSTTTITTPSEAEVTARVERVDGARDFSAIVDAGNGYLALRWKSDDGLPKLHRSLDGTDWKTLRITGDRLVDPEIDYVTTFGPLTVTPEGWALMATRRIGAVTTAAIDRLESRDGLDWRLDPDFVWDVADGQTTILEHDASTVVLLERRQTGSPLLAELLDDALADQLAGQPCAVNSVGSTLLVELCRGGGTRVSAEDTVAPELFDEVRLCAAHLTARPGGWSNIVVLHDIATATSVRHDISDTAFTGSNLVEGGVVILDTARSASDDIGTACDGLVDIAPSPPPRAIFVTVDGRTDVELPVAESVEYLPTASVGRGDSVVWWDGKTLWEVSPSGESTVLLERPDDVAPGRIAILSDDATSLVLQDWDGLAVAHLDGPTPRWQQVIFDDVLPNASLFEVDDRNIFLTNGVSLFRVEVTQ